MSFTSIEGVQPEGQGAAPSGDAPYAEYLNRVPEQYRADIEPIFREWDGNVTRRFQEASAYRRQWEPYEQAGINQWRADELASLVEFSRQYEDPGFRRSWVEAQARELGLLQEQMADEFDDDLIDPSVQQLLERELSPYRQQLEQMQQWREQQEQQQTERQIADSLERQYQALTEQHGDIDREVLEAFAQRHVRDDPTNAMQRGFEAMQRYAGGIEQRLMSRKLAQPGAPQSFGGPGSNAEAPRDLRSAEQAMVERLRARQTM